MTTLIVFVQVQQTEAKTSARVQTLIADPALYHSLRKLAARYSASPIGNFEVVGLSEIEHAGDSPIVEIADEMESARALEDDPRLPEYMGLPSETDLSLDYLSRRGWTIQAELPAPFRFRDPIAGEFVDFITACQRQDERDSSESLDGTVLFVELSDANETANAVTAPAQDQKHSTAI